jgi:hypothetical protein
MVAVGCVRAGLRIRERLAIQRRVGEYIRAVPFPADLNDLVASVGHLQGTSCVYRVVTAGGNTKVSVQYGPIAAPMAAGH